MFNPQQKHMLLTKLGYDGPADEASMEKFIASSPAAAAKIGKFESAAKKIMTPPEQLTGMAFGGLVSNALANANENFRGAFAGSKLRDRFGGMTEEQAAELKSRISQRNAREATQQIASGEPVRGTEEDPTLLQEAQEDWRSTLPEFSGRSDYLQTGAGDTGEGTGGSSGGGTGGGTPRGGAATIPQSVGQIDAPVNTVEAEQVDASTVEDINVEDAAQIDPTLIQEDVQEVLSNFEAVVADPSAKATIKGQMAEIMREFDEGTPPWAAPGMRKVMQDMAARGLGSSSMAGAAVIQSAIESAMPMAAADAKTYAEFQLKSMDNMQQAAIFKTQQHISALLSDQAAENAAKNFNAQSENQINMFRSQLEADVAKFNSAQVNAIAQFNAGEKNAIGKFNAEMKEQRQQFETKNAVLISQANAQMRNEIFKQRLANSAAIQSSKISADASIKSSRISADASKEAARIAAQTKLKMQEAELVTQVSQAQLAREQQAEQDALDRAFQQEENNKNRALTLVTTTMAADVQKELAAMANKQDSKNGLMEIIGTVTGIALESALDTGTP